MKLGFLDVQGKIEDTIELATRADRLGYSRYWLAEFPPQPSPIVIAAVIAGLTERIRIGTAAILFNYYPPKRTAHEFQLLERLYEGRIDAGLCSSTAIPHLIAADLEGRDQDQLRRSYPDRFRVFLDHLRNTVANPDYNEDLAWIGAPELPPPVWSLGAERSADLAAEHGTGYGYPLMYHQSVDDPATVQRYRDRFVPHAGSRPTVVVAICGVCGETDAAAEASAAPWKIFVPRVIGSAATCARQLAEIRVRYRADEVLFADMCLDSEQRIASMELLAAAARDRPELQDDPA